MLNFIARLLTGRKLLVVAVDIENRQEVEQAIAMLRRHHGVTPSDQKAVSRFRSLAKRKRYFPRYEPRVDLIDRDGATRTFIRSKQPKLFEALDYLHDEAEAASLSARELDRRIEPSRSTANHAQQYWRVPQNRDAYRAFRQQEDTDVPF